MIKTTFWTKNICVQTNDEFLTQNNSGSKKDFKVQKVLSKKWFVKTFFGKNYGYKRKTDKGLFVKKIRVKNFCQRKFSDAEFESKFLQKTIWG